MKIFLPALSILFLSASFSCSSDEKDNGPGYEFIDQEATGEIDNVAWTYEDGYVELEGDGGSELFVRLTLTQEGGVCNVFPEGDMVFFSVPNEEGLYKLKFDFSGNSSDYQTVTILKDETIPYNCIAAEGAVEITTISETGVTGKIDARCDDGFFVNGNFSVNFCPI